jgi:beta-phosphoglucomutase-like phosphatase (HAD superfamily)
VLARERSAVEPDRTLIIEDSKQGLRAAVASGAWVVSVRSGERLSHPRFVDAYTDLASLARALTPKAA